MFTKYITAFDPMKSKNQLNKLLRGSKYEIPTDNTSGHFREYHVNLYNEVLDK